jgi:hypothetical protein
LQRRAVRPVRRFDFHADKANKTHGGVVFLLFITMPDGKFVHGMYRYVALVRYARERHMMAYAPAG